MTLAELRAAIEVRGYDLATDADYTELINSAYRRVAGKRRWPWLERESAGTLPAGSGQVDLSVVEVAHLNWVYIRTGEGVEDIPLHRLKFVDYQHYLDHLFRHQDYRGIPQVWTHEPASTLIRFSPLADAEYSVLFGYDTEITPLSDEASEPLFSPQYHDVLVYGALVELASRQRDWPAHSVYERQYAERLSEMERAYGIRQRQTATQVRRSDFWSSVG